jgi:hypothetical protein
LTLFILSLPLFACAEEPGWVVEAEGQARIIEGDVEAAKAQAEREALRSALQYQIGVNIESQTVVHNAELVSDVIDAHVEGYAKKLEYIEKPHPDPKDPNYIRVKLKVWVSRNIHEVMEKLSNPKVIVVGVKVETSDLDERLTKLAKDRFSATIRSMLTDSEYEIAWLTDNQVGEVRKVIEKLAGMNIPKNERKKSTSELWGIGLGDLADLFLLGEVSFSIRDFEIPNPEKYPNLSKAKVVNLDGSVQAVRFDAENEATRLIIEKLIETEAKQKSDRAVRLAVDDAKPTVKALIDKIEEKMGPPNRLVVLYVKGLRSLEYQDFQEMLSQYEPYGVEKVRGVIFDKMMSKFILTFSEQSLVNGDLSQRVKYLATVINKSPNWKVTKTATRSMMIEKVSE